MEMYIPDLAWVKRGKQRRDVIKAVDGPVTPTEVAKQAGYSLNNTSRVLNDFAHKGLTKCLNPKDKTGRLYVLTKKGKVLKDKIR